MKKHLIIVLLSVLALNANAQGDVEYRWEIGAGAGLTAYEGDFNTSIVKGMEPNVTVLLRRILNPRMAVRLSGSLGKIKGSSNNVDTYYALYHDEPYEFEHTLTDVSALFEYNFWPYGTGKEYRGAKRLTPFIMGGIGFTGATGGDKNVFTANLPIGVGVKYRVSDRLNLGLEWGIHFTLSDKLDGVEDPYGIKSSGLFKNTDSYSALQFTATYSFSPKCRTCHNANE